VEDMGRKIEKNFHMLNFVFSVVYKAKCNKSGGIVALKKVLIQDENEGFPRATLKEMKCQQNLNNDNIVKLFGICRAPSMFV